MSDQGEPAPNADTKNAADSSISNAERLSTITPSVGNFRDRTFLGGIGLKARINLFTFAGLIALTLGGLGLFQADRELAAIDARLSQAHELAQLSAEIENAIWQFRAEGTDLALAVLRLKTSKRSDQENIAAVATLKAYGAEHTKHAAAIVKSLDRLYNRNDSKAVKEHITTLSEALAQYSESFGKKIVQKNAPPDLTGLELEMREAARSLEKLLADFNMLGLNSAMKSIRAMEMAFIENGRPETLVNMEKQAQEFSRLLLAIPLPGNDKGALEVLMNAYQDKLAAYAKGRMIARTSKLDRLAEIISYMSPSVEGIVTYSRRNLAETISAARERRKILKVLQGGGTSGLILLLVLVGAMVIRSVTAPVEVAASIGRHLADGKTDIIIGGLGNDDETGDIMRAFSALKKDIGEITKLREGMKKAKVEAERGRAATAEANWLRRDLESQKPELDNGREAIAEVQLLRKIIEATAEDITQKQAAPKKNLAAEIVEEQKAEHHPAPIDTISRISQQVALSSQGVTEAAEEAERTGNLIRNLTDAADKIENISSLIGSIARQADMLVVDMPPQDTDDGKKTPGFVVLPGDEQGTRESGDEREKISGVTRRFDIIRAEASQATWAVRDIAAIIRSAREAALGIARTTSADALEVTTDLLQQSENLRSMLDQLVHKMQDQLQIGSVPGEGEGDSGNV